MVLEIELKAVRLGVVGMISTFYTGYVQAACIPVSGQPSISIVRCGASVTSQDNKAAIDRALTSASVYGADVTVPAGIFLTSGKHSPPSGVAMTGRGTLKLTGGTGPIVDTTHSDNHIVGIHFDMSRCPLQCDAIRINGGSKAIVIDDISSDYGRIVANVSNGGAAPEQITIKDCTLHSVRVGGTSGGALEINSGTTHFVVSGNRILPPAGTAPKIGDASDGAGIAVATSASHGTISGNDSQWNAGNGIFMLSSQFVSIVGNQCSNNGQSGIDVSSAFTPRPSRLTITANICVHNRYDGLDINEAQGDNPLYLSIQGNHLEANGTPQTGGTGIYLQSTSWVTMSANTVLSNGTAGIWLNRSERNVISGNTIISNSSNGANACAPIVKTGACPGVLLYGSSYNTITGNVSANAAGLETQAHGILETDAFSDHNVYTGNITTPNLLGGLTTSGAHDLKSDNF